MSDLALRGQISEVGYSPDPGMSFEEWAEVGQTLGRIERASRWWIGDWLNFGERKYGEKYSQAMEATGLEYGSLADCGWVANRIELSRRREKLSWSHHREAAALDTQEEADAALDWAEETKATRSELRTYLKCLPGSSQSPCLATGCTVSDLNLLIQAGTKFGAIVADPPWDYSNTSTRGAAEDHYGTMSVEALAALPISDLAAEKSHLHLWTTNGFLAEAIGLVSAWGYEFKSCFVWVKPQMGMGNYWRVSHEFLLLGVRGSLSFHDKGLKSWGEFERRVHSAKPDEVRGLIERASPGPRLEMFGRKAVEGWTVWGNEVSRDLLTAGLEVVA